MPSMALFPPCVPACLGGFDILMILGVITVGAFGMLFFSYWPYRAALNALARGPLAGKPAALFILALLGAALWIAATWGFMVSVMSINERKTMPLFVLLGLAGTIGWFVLLVGYLSGRKRRADVAAEKLSAVPRFQVWFQDLLVALLCYGSGMTILAAAGDFNRSRADEFLPWAVYLFVAGSLGLLIATDVARRSAFCQRPLPRAGFYVAIFALFPLTLPVALLAWWRWRRTLVKAGT